MTTIWHEDDGRWRALAPTGFPNEAALHDLVAEAPDLLPLAGGPRLAVVGREVMLPSGYVDLLAVELSGRLVVIEVKLAANAEARRAVISQTLGYAAASALSAPPTRRRSSTRRSSGRPWPRTSSQAPFASCLCWTRLPTSSCGSRAISRE